MNRAVVGMMILCAFSVFARQDPPARAATPVSFFDVLDLPARVDEPRLEKIGGDQVLKCALANRGGEPIVGLRLTLMFVEAPGNGRITRTTWNEAAEVSPYSIRSFEFHPPLRNQTNTPTTFLAVDEVIGHDTIWRVVESDKLLRAYARGQHGLIPKVQVLMNKFDRELPRVRPQKLQPRIPPEEQQ